jgi:hypothetical protein
MAILSRLRTVLAGIIEKPSPRRRRHGLGGIERLEPRIALSASAMEVYAWAIINEMRADPPKFANELDGLYRNTLSQAHGVSASDPVWTDLRDMINRSKYPKHFQEALALMRTQPRLGPLAWSDDLELISQGHNDWMETHCYAHSHYEGQTPGTDCTKLPGLNQPGIQGDYDIVNPSVLGAWSSGAWGENISYDAGNSLPATTNRFGSNSDAYYQRLAYADTLGFMIEVNSSSLGHLRNLLSRDQMGTSAYGLADAKNKEIGRNNVIGIDFELFSGNLNTSNTTSLSTHTLSSHKRFEGGGGYIAGLAYEDRNGNSNYDVGEGVQVAWEICGPQICSEFWTSANNHGVISDYQVSNGRYEVTVTSQNHRVLGRQSVYIQDNNVWIEILVSSGFGLVDAGAATLVADLYEGGSGNGSQSTADPLGMIDLNTPLAMPTEVLSIHSSTDQDWFRFDVATGVAHVDILLGFKNSDGDVDAALYVLSGSGSLDLVRALNSTNDREQASLDLGVGTYFLKVYGYGGATNFYSLTIAGHTRMLELQAERDLTHKTGRAEGDGWSAMPRRDRANFLTQGPPISRLPAGTHTATFRMAVDATTGDNVKVATMSVFNAATKQILAERTIYRRDFALANTQQGFSVEFSTNAGQPLEFRVYWHGKSYVRQDAVQVDIHERLVGVPTNLAVQYQAETQLKHKTGRLDADGWSTVVGRDRKNYLIQGPAMNTLPGGTHAAVFRLLVDNNTLDDNAVATVSVYNPKTKTVLAQRILRRSDFASPSTYQDFAILFSTDAAQPLEFRVYWHGTVNVRADSVGIAYNR